MQQLLGVINNTVISIKRSASFYVIIVMLSVVSVFFSAFFNIKGEPSENISLSIDYSISAASMIIFISAIWVSCIEMNFDLEGHQIHLVFVKPVRRVIVWIGKFTGILIIHTLFLIISFSIIYTGIMWKTYNSSYSRTQISQIESEILIGRKTFFPEIAGLDNEVDGILKTKINAAYEKNEPLSESKIEGIRQDIIQNVLIKRGEIKPNSSKIFQFNNIDSKYSDIILEYRIFIGEIDLIDRQIRQSSHILWYYMDNKAKSFDSIFQKPEKIISNVEYRTALPVKQIADDKIALKIDNLDSKPIFFQLTEGPEIKVKYSGFAYNYLKGLAIVFLGLVLVTGLGCSLGGLLSFPIAAFSIIAYLTIGAISGLIYSNAVELNQNLSIQTKLGYMINGIILKLVPTVQTFQPSEFLSSGRLIEWNYIFEIFKNNLALHGIVIFSAGIILYSLREVGLINKK